MFSASWWKTSKDYEEIAGGYEIQGNHSKGIQNLYTNVLFRHYIFLTTEYTS